MLIIFYIAAAVAVISTLLVITRHNLVHALLYLVVSFLAVAMLIVAVFVPMTAVAVAVAMVLNQGGSKNGSGDPQVIRHLGCAAAQSFLDPNAERGGPPISQIQPAGEIGAE